MASAMSRARSGWKSAWRVHVGLNLFVHRLPYLQEDHHTPSSMQALLAFFRVGITILGKDYSPQGSGIHEQPRANALSVGQSLAVWVFNFSPPLLDVLRGGHAPNATMKRYDPKY